MPMNHATESRRWRDEANSARAQGQLARALTLYGKAMASHAADHETAYEAGLFAIEMNQRLAGVAHLYDRHRASFLLPALGWTDRVGGTKLGPDGERFGLECLTRATAFPGVPADWLETMSSVLVRRGELDAALQWRQRLNRRDTLRLTNRLAMARLYEELGRFDDALRHYCEIRATWPRDPESTIAWLWLEERQGRAIEIPADPMFAPVHADEHVLEAYGRVLHVIWTASRRGPHRVPAIVCRRLVDLVHSLCAKCPNHPGSLLAEGYLALFNDEFSTARRKFVLVSLAVEGGVDLATNNPAYDSVLHDALHWARVILADPAAVRPTDQRLPPIDRANLLSAHAHEMWCTDEKFSAMGTYAEALGRHHVAAAPLRYEIRGAYKVLFHEGRYYAVPRTVSAFTIIDGRVYRLGGRSHHGHRRVPPWIAGFAYWAVGRLGMSGRSGFVYRGIRRALGWHLFERFRSSYVGTAARRLAWTFYQVKGVLVSRTREQLFTQLDRQGSAH